MDPNKEYKEHCFKPSVDGDDVIAIRFESHLIVSLLRDFKDFHEKNSNGTLIWSTVGSFVEPDAMT